MDSGLISVLLWIGFLILGQWTRKLASQAGGGVPGTKVCPSSVSPRGPSR